MTAAIQIDSVEKSYKGFKALKGVSLNIEQGVAKSDRPVTLAVAHADSAPNL